MNYLKKFTSLLLVFALFSLHIESGAIAFSSAYAIEDESSFEQVDLPNITNASNEFMDQEKDQPAESSANNTNSNTPQSNNASIDMESGRQEAKLTMNQLMVLVILLTGPTVGIGCINTISGKLFSAGAAIYLVKEIMNYKSYKEAVTSTEKMYAELSDNPDVNEEQINSFITAEQMENIAADALKKRKDNTKILALAVTAASIASFAESIWGTSAYTACTAASVGTGACACEEVDKGIQSCMFAPCAKLKDCAPEAANAACMITDASDLKPDNLNSEYGPSQYANSQPDFDSLNEFMLNSAIEEQGKDLQVSRFVSTLISSFLSSAYADTSPASKGGPLSGLGLTGAALGGVLAWYALNQFTFINKLGVGWIRGIFFGVLAGFAWAAVSELKKGEEKLRSNANIYKSLHERLRAAMDSKAKLANLGGISSAVRDRLARFQGIRDNMNNPKDGAICLVGNLGEQRVDENCSCRKNNSCSKVDLSAVDFGGLGLPGFFGQTAGGLQSGANSLFSGNLAGADSAFAGVGSNAANLRKLNDRVKGSAIAGVNSANKGKKPVDLKSLESKIIEDVQKLGPSLIKSAQAKNGPALAAFGIGSSGISSGLVDNPKDLTPKSLVASISSKAAPAPAAKTKAMDFNFDFPTEQEASSDTEVALSQGDALNEFESNESDISARPDENIFNIITVRYFKSAYPRIFNEQASERQSLE
tara:strand:- start:5178 stop:7298 length:2121 start_codon:yes stop_codon:yes gene_type:complete